MLLFSGGFECRAYISCTLTMQGFIPDQALRDIWPAQPLRHTLLTRIHTGFHRFTEIGQNFHSKKKNQ